MEQNKGIGELIKILRIERKLSQSALAELCNYSRSALSMIENGTRIPSDDLLLILSNTLNFDFLQFYQGIQNYKTLEHYILTNKLSNFINIGAVSDIADLLHNDVIINEFDYGEPLYAKQYCQLLVYAKQDDNIDLALDYCINILQIDINNINSFKPQISMPKYYNSIIIVFGYCLIKKNQLQNSILISKIHVKFLEDTYINNLSSFSSFDPYYKKLYIILLNNLSDTLLVVNEFDAALSVCNKGIQQSCNLNILSILPQLLAIKVEILYNLKDFEESKEVYLEFKYLCRTTNNNDYFSTTMDRLLTKYPNLFE